MLVFNFRNKFELKGNTYYFLCFYLNYNGLVLVWMLTSPHDILVSGGSGLNYRLIFKVTQLKTFAP